MRSGSTVPGANGQATGIDRRQHHTDIAESTGDYGIGNAALPLEKTSRASVCAVAMHHGQSPIQVRMQNSIHLNTYLSQARFRALLKNRRELFLAFTAPHALAGSVSQVRQRRRAMALLQQIILSDWALLGGSCSSTSFVLSHEWSIRKSDSSSPADKQTCPGSDWLYITTQPSKMSGFREYIFQCGLLAEQTP